uniref:Putative histone-lysine n-methyltransferase mll2 n=1 Tax=Anopheles braziliensis TaxID=58242 RepID=A0A2M3YXL2_9DIPT
MLPACFGSINDLAAFIAKNNLNSPTGNTGSRQQLQKKILQREMKEKRKLSAVALKKRRKKRRRTISTSISETASELRNGTPPEADCNQQPETFGLPGTVSTKQTATIGQQQQQQHLHPPSMVDHQLLLQQHMIKREQQDCLDEDNNNTTTSGALAAGAASGKLLILQRQQQQSTNLNCDNRTDTGAFESIGKELLAAASYSGDAQVHGQSLMGPTNHLPPTPPQSLQQPQLIHQRLLEGGEEMRSPQEQPSFLSNVYCKKVRQAQQLKAVQQQQQQQQLQQQLQQQQQQQHLAPPHPLHQQQLFFPNRPSSASKRQLTNSLGYASRQKRLKLLQARQQRSLESQNNSAPRYDEQGNLILIESQDPSRDEFIIPRERVISICNMDKNALDDYLNCDDEENSQDQDQELLKYFPQEEEEDTVLANVGGGQSSSSVGFGPTTPTSTTTQDADTTTGGYGGPLGDDCEQKLFQIRMILEKNQSNQNKQMQQSMAEAQLANASSSGSSASCAATGFEHQSGMSLPAGSAAASLAMLSQRHNTHGGSSGSTVSVPEPSGATAGGKQKFCGTLDLKQSSGGGTIDGGGTGYELGGGGPSSMVLQSPTARRRNCSFVPISHPISSGKQHLHQQQQQQQQQQHQTPNVSPFVSPRSTPIHRKPPKGPTNAGHTLNMLEAKLNHQLQQQQQQQLPSSGGPFLQQHLHHQQQQQQQHQQQHSFRSSGSVYIKNELPASAPPSPSLMQPFRFVSSMASGGGLNCGPLLSQPTVFQPIGGGPHQQQLQTANINSSTTTTTTPGGLPMTLEARSSSVPLLPNYDSYCNSSYNSVSQTPVPSEYDDFTDTGILDMLTEQSSTAQLTSTSSIKIEDAAELSMLSADLLDQQQTLQSQDQDRAASSAGGGFYSRAGGDGSGSIFNIISRSVPSTPLPMLGGGGMFGGPGAGGGKLGSSFAGNGGGAIVGGMGSRGRSMFELPKSVPSTPIMLGGGGGDGSCQDIPRMFQFSPEPSRDFLINGNSVDRSKSSSAASASNFYSSALGSVSGGGGGNGGGGLTGANGLGIASVTGVTDANGNVVSGSDMASLPTRAGGVSVSGGGGNGVGSSCSMHATGSNSNHHHHHAASAHPEPPTADMANLTDGIEGLSSDLDAVTDSMIDSDILQNL